MALQPSVPLKAPSAAIVSEGFPVASSPQAPTNAEPCDDDGDEGDCAPGDAEHPASANATATTTTRTALRAVFIMDST
jgi:hypothetical protein